MRNFTLLITFIAFATLGISQQKNSFYLAFGSCCHQDEPQDIWGAVVASQPDVFLFLGDNIYADTYDMELMRSKYRRFSRKPGFQKLKKICPIIATWDDHDYGYNDAGSSYRKKRESQQIFLDFFEEDLDSTRRKTPGIYTSYFYEVQGKKIQVILLDVRYFRSPLLRILDRKKQLERKKRIMGAYVQAKYQGATMLGETQWQWLEKELRKPASVRIIATSTQFLTYFNGWEAWQNMPKEYERMLSLIRKTQANGVLFLSGDTHWAELSCVKVPGLYPIFDLTSSGLTEVWEGLGPNQNRVASYLGKNFGGVKITPTNNDVKITLEVFDVEGTSKIQRDILLSELQILGEESRAKK
ncbi:alkaline phosphatase D family protein [Candidatus Uabimicrobium sp. HlEnr_7]|uniref:alkaline phosphatase D family protein n=1 Tax=Candidatus Uabimicrobium helgolandensis TaxID=3095367 RepID=UPI0035574A2B